MDGDADPDVAVANKEGNSVTLYHNGGGSFDSTTYPAGGQPVAVALADFGRDGRADLAVGLADRKALAVWKAAAGGGFDPGQAQWIYFQNPPSALSADNFDGLNGPDVLLGFADFYKLALCTSDAAGALGLRLFHQHPGRPRAGSGQPRHPDRERRPEHRRRHRLRRRVLPRRRGRPGRAALQPGPLSPQRQPVLFRGQPRRRGRPAQPRALQRHRHPPVPA